MKKIRLGDYIYVKRGMSLPGDNYATEGKYKRLTLGNFDYPNGGFKENTSKADIYYTGDVRDEFILKKDDIITPLTEQVPGLLGSTAFIPKSDTYIQSGDVGLVIPDESKIDKNYAYYLLSSYIVKKQLASSAQQTKIRHTSPNAIMNCVAWIPEFHIQKKIGSFLRAIDQAIETNKQINDNLVEQLHRLYEYWFVQFEFPAFDSYGYKSSGGEMKWSNIFKRSIPAAWQEAKMKDIVSLERGVSYTSDMLSTTGIAMINLGSFAADGAYKPENLKYITPNSNISFVDTNDLILCLTQQSAPDLEKDIAGKTLIVPTFKESKVCISQDLARIKTNPIYRYYLYEETRQLHYCKYIIKFATGTSIYHLAPDGFLEYPILIPDSNTLESFNAIANGILDKQDEVLQENDKLKQLREYLLPLLLNGHLQI